MSNQKNTKSSVNKDSQNLFKTERLYKPIENYGMIGDMNSVALVATDGSIDWFCYPKFDSPSLFGRILDRKKGGFFQIYPMSDRETTSKQLYWPDTNILVTRFFCADGIGEVADFMPVGEVDDNFKRRIFRVVRCVRGSVTFRLVCRPSFNFARTTHTATKYEQGVIFNPNDQTASKMFLTSDTPVNIRSGGAFASFTLTEGDVKTFTVCGEPHFINNPKHPRKEESFLIFRQSVKYWRKWISKSTYSGRWREMVHRSAFALKLLTYEPTGAIVAAPTCSLPETLGGERNWDYRYTWIRDAAFTVYAFMRIGFTEEARQFMMWIEQRCKHLNEDGSLHIMYSIDGNHKLNEESLTNLEGYRQSSPVRIGNEAHNQLQLDIYGELLDAVYLYNKYGEPISYEFWTYIIKLIDYVCDNWMKEDEGVWEMRSGRRHFVYSKLMCWVALDRAIRLADKRSFPCDRTRWLRIRDEIYREIMSKGWCDEREAFVQSYGSKILDASNMMMSLSLFVSPTDPKMISTIEATLESPKNGGLLSGNLMYRYNVDESEDGLLGEEGTFNICTFWLVEVLTRASKKNPEYLERARLIFEKMLSFANHVGLFAEETGARGEALGNFPQAFTHLALISAAYNLDKVLDGKH